MKKLIDVRFAYLFALLSIGSVLVAQRAAKTRSENQVSSARARAAASPFPAFTATFEERLTPPGAPSYVSRRLERAFRSDGSVAEIEDTVGRNGKPGFTVRNIYRADGILAIARDSLHVVVATRNALPNPRSDINRFDPDRGCASTFGGVSNFRVASTTESFPGFGLITTRLERDDRGTKTTIWRIPTLSCLEARRLAEFTVPGSAASSQSDLILTGLQMAEPRSEIFSIPGNYALVSPTQSFEKLMAALGTELCENDRKLLALADADYAKNRVTDVASLR